MKTKKLLISLVSTITACASLTGILAGCSDNAGNTDDCDHVYKWAITTPATCVAEGVETGTCGICGDKITRPVDVDPENHNYGDWVITQPTSEVAGSAQKVCTYDATHIYSVKLPVLSDDGAGYTSVKVTTAPTPLTAGEKTYTLETELGNVVITAPVAARGVQSVQDAVNVAVANASNIRKGTGTVYSDLTDTTFSYEFGDNYTHIVDNADSIERWLSYDENGEFWGVIREDGTIKKDSRSDYMAGYSYAFGRSGGQRSYGAEDLLSDTYAWGLSNTNKDFTEEVVTKEDGSTEYTFSFGHFNAPTNFCIITVTFTLKDTYELNTLNAEILAYVNNENQGYTSWEQDEEGIVSLIEYSPEEAKTKSYHYTDGITFKQVSYSELSLEDEPLPENAYSKDKLLISGIELTTGGKVLEEGAQLSMTASKQTSFTLKILPTTANLTLDPMNFYVKNADGTLTAIDYSTIDTVGVNAYYTKSTGILNVRSQIAGIVTLVIKTELYTREIECNVAAVEPSSISPAVYTYSVNGYVWDTSTAATKATIYVGQHLYFMAQVPTSEKNYADSSFTAKVTSGSGTIEDWTDGENTGMSFVASSSGTVTITLTSAYPRSTKTCTITVTVEEAPTASQLFNRDKTYTATLNYPEKGDVEVTFTPDDSYTEGTVTVKFVDGTSEKLSYTYSNGVLTTSHHSQLNKNVVLTLNDAYDLVLTHPTGFGDKTETVILTAK